MYKATWARCGRSVHTAASDHQFAHSQSVLKGVIKLQVVLGPGRGRGRRWGPRRGMPWPSPCRLKPSVLLLRCPAPALACLTCT